ncbi:MAG: 3-methyl-2-oxobutanoate hydroxymethyltransferase [Spirochaetales bacterium]|nr:3-methyl-2-oxobutanoate hydroxymethyltransferase [Spirochaetales bacterium]
MMKKNPGYFREKKKKNEKIVVLTSYDYPTTVILEEAGVDMIILGDSVGTNILGYRDETEVTMEDMLHHTRAVARGIRSMYLVVDLPYRTHETAADAVANARKLVAAGADAVKFEGIKEDILAALKGDGLEVMCHIGLNPQYDQDRMKRGEVSRGKDFEDAVRLLEGARRLEGRGMDLLVLEKIPERIAEIVTANIATPTIGIGAGKYCDGQVLIVTDLLGVNERKFKHVPDYVDLRRVMIDTVRRYRAEIEAGVFPGREHINLIKHEEYEKVKDWCLAHGLKVQGDDAP